MQSNTLQQTRSGVLLCYIFMETVPEIWCSGFKAAASVFKVEMHLLVTQLLQ